MPLNDAACGQAPAKAKRIRVAVLVTRAAILSRFLLVAKVRFRRREKLTTPSGSWHSIGPRWQRRASSKNVSEKASIIIRLKTWGIIHGQASQIVLKLCSILNILSL